MGESSAGARTSIKGRGQSVAMNGDDNLHEDHVCGDSLA